MNEDGEGANLGGSMSKPRFARIWPVLLAGTFITAAISCGEAPSEPGNLPDNHTVNKDGARHAPGLENPTTNCVECHGADLRGGAAGQPSCFSCHSKVWP